MFEKSGPILTLAAFVGFFLTLFLVFRVLETEFFRGDPDLGGEATPIRNAKTALAHSSCARYAAQRLNLDATKTLALPEYTAWDLGFDRYLVKANVQRTDDPAWTQPYLCKIVFRGSQDQDAGNWLVQNIDFVP